MKTLFAVLLTAVSAQAAHVQFDLADFVASAIARRVIYVTPRSTPRTNDTYVITSDSIRRYTDAAGQCIVSNMVDGVYDVLVYGPDTNTVFHINVPIFAGLTNARLILTTTNSVPSATTGYTQSQADGRFVKIQSGVATNLSGEVSTLTITNLRTAPGVGTSNYFWRLTNAATGQGEWAAAPGAAGGEDNYNADAGITNATVHGLVAGRTGTTNTIRTLEQGANIVITNQGTNLVIASTASGDGSGETNYLDNAGVTNGTSRFGLAATKIGTTNQVKTLSEGNWITLAETATNISITAEGLQPLDSDLTAIAAMSGSGVFPVQISAGSWTTLGTNQFLTKDAVLASLADVTTSGVAAGQVLSWNGVTWTNKNDADTGAIVQAPVSFTNYSAGTNWLRAEGWGLSEYLLYDDFSRPNTTNGGLVGMLSPQGIPYIVRGPNISDVATNRGRIQDGYVVVDENNGADNPTIYLAGNSYQPLTLFGMRYQQRVGSNPGTNKMGGVTIAVSQGPSYTSKMLHLSLDTDGVVLGITTNGVGGLQNYLGASLLDATTNGQHSMLQLEYLGTNTVMVSWGGTNCLVHAANIDSIWTGTNWYFQTGASSGTNGVDNWCAIDAVWAGATRYKLPLWGNGLAWSMNTPTNRSETNPPTLSVTAGAGADGLLNILTNDVSVGVGVTNLALAAGTGLSVTATTASGGGGTNTATYALDSTTGTGSSVLSNAPTIGSPLITGSPIVTNGVGVGIQFTASGGINGIVTANRIGTTTSSDFKFLQNNTDYWNLIAGGHLRPVTSNQVDLGSPTLPVRVLNVQTAVVRNAFNVLGSTEVKDLTVTGTFTSSNSAQSAALQLYDADASHWTGIKSPDTVLSNNYLVLPAWPTNGLVGLTPSDSTNVNLVAITTSAGVAGKISDETGTGVMVFDNAPTITDATLSGTPLISDFSFATHTHLDDAAGGVLTTYASTNGPTIANPTITGVLNASSNVNVDRLVVTNWPQSTVTFAADGTESNVVVNLLTAAFQRIDATNQYVHFVHATNKSPTDNWVRSARIKLYAGPANRTLSFNSAWKMLTTTNILGSNKVAIIAIEADGPAETNVVAAVAMQQ